MNYVECIGISFPGVQVSCAGDPTVYENIVWETGDPMPTQAALDAAMLDNRRNVVWEQLHQFRDKLEAEIGTPVMIEGVKKWFHSDDPSKIKQLALVKAADLGQIPPNLPWKTMDKTFVIMTNAVAYSVYIEAMLMSTQIFAVAEQHRQAILTSENPESYDWSTGWPQTFEEYQASL